MRSTRYVCVRISVLVFMADSIRCFPDWSQIGRECIAAARAVGAGDPFVLFDGLACTGAKNPKELASRTKLYVTSALGFPNVSMVDTSSSIQCCRSLIERQTKPMSWRANRSYFVTDAVAVTSQPDCQSSTGATDAVVSMRITGFIRGKPLPLNSLMHVAGVGASRLVSVRPTSSPFDQCSKGRRAEQFNKGCKNGGGFVATHDDMALEQESVGGKASNRQLAVYADPQM